jgi:hypothetical protein
MCWDGVGEKFGAYFRVNIAHLRPQQRLLHVAPILLTPCSIVIFEKLTGLQLVKNLPAFYGTRRFITASTSARHLSLS